MRFFPRDLSDVSRCNRALLPADTERNTIPDLIARVYDAQAHTHARSRVSRYECPSCHINRTAMDFFPFFLSLSFLSPLPCTYTPGDRLSAHTSDGYRAAGTRAADCSQIDFYSIHALRLKSQVGPTTRPSVVPVVSNAGSGAQARRERVWSPRVRRVAWKNSPY